MKILYLKGYKWLLSLNQRVRIDFLGYIRYEALAKHVKLFLKNIKVKRHQCPYYKGLLYKPLKQNLFKDFRTESNEAREL